LGRKHHLWSLYLGRFSAGFGRCFPDTHGLPKTIKRCLRKAMSALRLRRRFFAARFGGSAAAVKKIA